MLLAQSAWAEACYSIYVRSSGKVHYEYLECNALIIFKTEYSQPTFALNE